jgi:hypothetical protein
MLAAALLTVAIAAPAHAAGLASSHVLHFSPLAFAGLALGTSAIAVASPFNGFLPSQLVDRVKKPVFIPLEWLALAAGAGGAASVTPDTNHDLVITKIVYTSRDAANALVDRPLLLANLSITNSDEFTLKNKPVELENIAGINRGSPELIIPIVVPAGQTFEVFLTNGSAAALNVRATVVGFRVPREAR